MIIIRREQMNILSQSSLGSFEDRMVAHVGSFFPNHYKIMGEARIRGVIRYGYDRAKRHGLTTQRNVCLYLNQMLILGSDFDNDPQVPWAAETLDDANDLNPQVRIDTLADRVARYFHEISGPDHQYLNRVLIKIHRQSRALFSQPISENFELQALDQLRRIWPKKYESVGESNLLSMIRLGTEVAARYGITHKQNLLKYVAFMFLIGSRFDIDPQFSWAGDILKENSIADQGSRTTHLYETMMNHLDSFIAKE
jgi:hypothetical protein